MPLLNNIAYELMGFSLPDVTFLILSFFYLTSEVLPMYSSIFIKLFFWLPRDILSKRVQTKYLGVFM